MVEFVKEVDDSALAGAALSGKTAQMRACQSFPQLFDARSVFCADRNNRYPGETVFPFDPFSGFHA